ncbi:MAG: class C sortase [Actinomycetia bacterium]|nr:class C sortase [Actinomycetes bacterium]
MLLLLTGVGVLLYPVLATTFNNTQQREFAERYNSEVQGVSDDRRAAALERAREYNEGVGGVPILDPWLTEVSGSPTSGPYEDYLTQLADTEAMARLRVPGINVDLPIFHGTEDDTLARGIGHLYGTSLPVGGSGQHSVLTSHTGLSNATLFDNLDKVEIGDIFYIDVYGETLAYQVQEITIVLPTELESLVRVNGEDLVTLVTCTPYAVNTHRLLVRGQAVPLEIAEEAPVLTRAGEGMQLWMFALIGAAALSLLLYLLLLLRSRRRRAADPVDETRADLDWQSVEDLDDLDDLADGVFPANSAHAVSYDDLRFRPWARAQIETEPLRPVPIEDVEPLDEPELEPVFAVDDVEHEPEPEPEPEPESEPEPVFAVDDVDPEHEPEPEPESEAEAAHAPAADVLADANAFLAGLGDAPAGDAGTRAEALTLIARVQEQLAALGVEAEPIEDVVEDEPVQVAEAVKAAEPITSLPAAFATIISAPEPEPEFDPEPERATEPAPEFDPAPERAAESESDSEPVPAPAEAVAQEDGLSEAWARIDRLRAELGLPPRS